MKLLRSILLFVCLCTGVVNVAAQMQARFAHYLWNILPYNAATAGKDDALNLTFSSRIMWTGLEGAPRTQNFSAHLPLGKTPMSAGVLFYHDGLGVQTANCLRAMMAYKMRIGDGKLSFGLSGGMRSELNQWSNITTVAGDDPVFSQGNEQITSIEAGAGVYYQDQRSFAGISIPSYSLTESDNGTSQNSHIHAQFIAGTKLTITRSIDWKPSVLIDYESSAHVSAEITQMFSIKNFFELGAGYKTGQAWNVLMRINVNRQFYLAYALDIYTGDISRLNGGTHDLTIAYIFKYNTHSPDTRMIPSR